VRSIEGVFGVTIPAADTRDERSVRLGERFRSFDEP